MRRKISFLLLSAVLCLYIGIALSIESDSPQKDAPTTSAGDRKSFLSVLIDESRKITARQEGSNDGNDDNNNEEEEYDDNNEDDNNWNDNPEDYRRFHHNNKSPKDFCEKVQNHCEEAGINTPMQSRRNLRRDGASPVISNVTELCDEQNCVAYVENHKCFIKCSKGCFKDHKDDEEEKMKCKQGCLTCVDPEKPDRRRSVRRTESQHNVQFENPAVTGHGPRPQDYCEILGDLCQVKSRARMPLRIAKEDLCDHTTCVDWMQSHRCFMPCMHKCMEDNKDNDENANNCIDNTCYACEDKVGEEVVKESKKQHGKEERRKEEATPAPVNPDEHHHGEGHGPDGRPDPQRLCHKIKEGCVYHDLKDVKETMEHDDPDHEEDDDNNDNDRFRRRRRITKQELCDPAICVPFMTSHECYAPCAHNCHKDHNENDNAGIDACLETCFNCQEPVSTTRFFAKLEKEAIDAQIREEDNGLAAPADGPKANGGHPHHGSEEGHHNGGKGMHNPPDPERLCHKIAEGCLLKEVKGDNNNNRFRQMTKEALCDQAACVAFMTSHQCFSPCAHECHEKLDDDAAIDACIEEHCFNCQDFVPAESPAAERQGEMAPGPVEGDTNDHNHQEGGDEHHQPDIKRTCHKIHEGCMIHDLKDMKDAHDEEDDDDDHEDDNNNRFRRRITKDDLCDEATCVAFMATHRCYAPCAEQCYNDHGPDNGVIDACIESKCLTCQDGAPPPARRFAKIVKHSAKINRRQEENAVPVNPDEHHHGEGHSSDGRPDPQRLCHKIKEGCVYKDLKDVEETLDHEDDNNDNNNDRFRRRITKQELCDPAICVPFMTSHECYAPCAHKCFEDHEGNQGVIDACMEGCLSCGQPPVRHSIKNVKQETTNRRRDEHPGEQHHGEGPADGNQPDPQRTCHKIHEGCVYKDLKDVKDTLEHDDPDHEDDNNDNDRFRRRITKQDLCDEATCVAFMTTHQCYAPCAEQCYNDHGPDNGLIDACIESKCLNCQDSVRSSHDERETMRRRVRIVNRHRH